MKLSNLFDYFFHTNPAPNSQDTARRSGFLAFQTYPENEIQGRGVLVSQNGVFGCKYWNIDQAPQTMVFGNLVPTENMGGSGTIAGTFYGQVLLPNPNDPNGI